MPKSYFLYMRHTYHLIGMVLSLVEGIGLPLMLSRETVLLTQREHSNWSIKDNEPEIQELNVIDFINDKICCLFLIGQYYVPYWVFCV